jgi:cytochrome P450
LAFAAGPYRCIGAQLASFEVERALGALLRYPALRLSSEPPVWTDRMNIAPLRRLPACFTGDANR